MGNCLVIRSAALREFESDTTAGQSSVDLAIGIKAVVNATTLLLVQDDLEQLAAVLLRPGALADNLDGVDEVGEDGLVDRGQGARTGALLLLVGARAGGALGAGENAAGSDEEDMAVGELLLELTGETVGFKYIISFASLQVIRHGSACSYRCWILWKFWRRGTGTKMTMAFFPWPTSICIEAHQLAYNSHQSPTVETRRWQMPSPIHLACLQRASKAILTRPNYQWHNSPFRDPFLYFRTHSSFPAFPHTKQPENCVLTSRAETNCKGLRAALRSGVLVSRSARALARAVSSSEGCCLDGLFAAILLMAAMIVDKDGRKAACFLVDSRKEWRGCRDGR